MILGLGGVSIPNGMEFYFPNPTKSDTEYPVSIPNGMEFYLATLAKSSKFSLSFNSQRDGILRNFA